jgi:hypothetical protein
MAKQQTLADRAKAAKSSADYIALATEISAEMTKLQTRLMELEADRGQAALEGRGRENNMERWSLGEDLTSLQKALADAERRRDDAETREVRQAMLDGTKRARALVPAAMAAFDAVDAAMTALGTAIVGLLDVRAKIDSEQAHAVRCIQQRNISGEPIGEAEWQKLREMTVNWLAVRAMAAERVTVTPHRAENTRGDADAFEVHAQLLLESLLKNFIHRGPWDASRYLALVNRKAIGRPDGVVVDFAQPASLDEPTQH